MPAADVYLYLGSWASTIRKLGADFVLAHACFQEAAANFSPGEIAELYRRLRERCFDEAVPEDHWREEFIRVFWRGREMIPQIDWEMYQAHNASCLYRAIAEGTAGTLRLYIEMFARDGFRIEDVRVSLATLFDEFGGEWTVAAGWPDEVFSPLQFAEWRGRTEMAAILRQAQSEQPADLA